MLFSKPSGAVPKLDVVGSIRPVSWIDSFPFPRPQACSSPVTQRLAIDGGGAVTPEFTRQFC